MLSVEEVLVWQRRAIELSTCSEIWKGSEKVFAERIEPYKGSPGRGPVISLATSWLCWRSNNKKARFGNVSRARIEVCKLQLLV